MKAASRKTCDMLRISGYAPKDAKFFEKHDRQAKQRPNAVAVGALNGDCRSHRFLTAVSLFFIKMSKSKDLLKVIDACIKYFSAYSPDLNPIEHKRTPAKAHGRKLRCSADELFQQNALQSFYFLYLYQLIKNMQSVDGLQVTTSRSQPEPDTAA